MWERRKEEGGHLIDDEPRGGSEGEEERQEILVGGKLEWGMEEEKGVGDASWD